VILNVALFFIPLQCQKDDSEVRRQEHSINNKKKKRYEKDDDRPRGNVRDDNEC
jgi:hypothetical protein